MKVPGPNSPTSEISSTLAQMHYGVHFIQASWLGIWWPCGRIRAVAGWYTAGLNNVALNPLETRWKSQAWIPPHLKLAALQLRWIRMYSSFKRIGFEYGGHMVEPELWGGWYTSWMNNEALNPLETRWKSQAWIPPHLKLAALQIRCIRVYMSFKLLLLECGGHMVESELSGVDTPHGWIMKHWIHLKLDESLRPEFPHTWN